MANGSRQERNKRRGDGRVRPGPDRQRPLPWSAPKPVEDDPEAVSRVEAILASPSYVRADQDPQFLNRDDVRASRLGLEYLKTELLLNENGIESTIVLFGGTRVVEPAEARRRLEAARRALDADPESLERRRCVEVAERIIAKSKYYDVARELARMISNTCQDGEKCSMVVITGGGPGIMEAGNRGAFEMGAKSIGLNIQLPHEQYPNPYISPELCFQFRYFALRKLHFLLRAKALVAFPGGYGTMDELFETLTLIQTRKIAPLPVVLVGESFWRSAFDADFLAREGVIDPEDVRLFHFAETAHEIWDHIVSWYHNQGEEVFNSPG